MNPLNKPAEIFNQKNPGKSKKTGNGFIMTIKSGKSSGFTLIEIVVALSIITILATMAVPSLLVFIRSNRVAGQSSDFLTALALARNEAITRGAWVGVAPTNPAGNANTNNEFGKGWNVFIDVNANNVFDAGDTILRTYAYTNNSITLGSIPPAPAVAAIEYLPTGFINTAGGATPPLDICARTGETGRQITILVSGQVHVNYGFMC
ncbi:MAG: GspH/FimT family pseudopilin [Nitrospiria bacterium]